MKRNRDKSKKASKKDFSGLDFENEVFEKVDFHESIFNGAYFSNARFLNCDLRHTEFTESKFTNCEFVNSQLDYSDFVYTQANNMKFMRCSFSQGEWRENKLKGLSFQECSFDNATISLSSFKKTSFDLISSTNFCGASKRFNVFSETDFELPKDRIDFLRNNFGIVLRDPNSRFLSDKKHQKDFFLSLSLAKYTARLNSDVFIDLMLKAIDQLARSEGKNRLQSAKYLSLICKLTAEEGSLSIFAQELLISALNSSCKSVSDSQILLEIVDLIMFIKTYQFNAIKAIEADISDSENRVSEEILFQFKLDNTYEKQDAQDYLRQMASFLTIPVERLNLIQFRSGSTIFELIVNHSVALSSVLLFIHLSLSQVNKILEDVLRAKKNISSLSKKRLKKRTKTQALVRMQDVTPLSIMLNQGNKNYDRINRLVNQFGRAVAKIDGKGEVRIKVLKRQSER